MVTTGRGVAEGPPEDGGASSSWKKGGSKRMPSAEMTMYRCRNKNAASSTAKTTSSSTMMTLSAERSRERPR